MSDERLLGHPVGSTVVVRERWHGRVWSERPMIVAFDEPDALGLRFPCGTSWKAPTTPPGRPRAATRGERLARCLALNDWVLAEREWDVDSLWLSVPGAAHATLCSWQPDGSHLGWYVNLQDPFIRTADMMLDVVVEPDRSWRWKDEDELSVMIEMGVITAAKADDIRSEGKRVVADIEAGTARFCAPWPNWRPDPTWPLRPAL